VEELVAAAAKKTPLPESAAEQQRIISGITELTLPTFEQVVDYSPNTRGILHAARSAVKKVAPRKASKKTARRVAKKR
jgi:hypothetical protein